MMSLGLSRPATGGTLTNNGNTSNTSSNTTNNTNNSSNSLIHYSPSQPTVDYDSNVTPLYAAIGRKDWMEATRICEGIYKKMQQQSSNGGGNNVVNEAAVWVVRRDTSTANNPNTANNNVQWRFLPIHSTCALSPPHSFLRLLLQLHPPSSRTLDHQGLLPLHYACGSQSSREVIYTLLMSFPGAAVVEDPRGMMPLHYLSQWGPAGGNLGVVEMVLVGTGERGNWKVSLKTSGASLLSEPKANEASDYERSE